MNLRATNLRGSGFRKRIWDIYNGYHCSIVGTCLRREELRKLAKKKAFGLDEEAGYFALHTATVALAAENSARAKALHNLLDTKYQSAVIRYARVKTDDAIETLWRIDLSRGAIAGAFWAIMTHLSPSSDLVHRIYGEIHMLGHDFLGDHQKNLQQLHELRDKTSLFQDILVSERQHFKRQIQELEEKVADLILEQKNNALLVEEREKLKTENESLRYALLQDGSTEELHKLKLRIAFLLQNCASLSGSADHLSAELQRVHEKNSELKDINAILVCEKEEQRQELLSLEAALISKNTLPGCANCADQKTDRCPGPDLCGKKVLYVGGQHKMVPHYQQLVENYGGQFMHHDGGVEVSRNQLPKMLGSADIVFCPVDCVSHDACTCVKKMCKHFQKPFVMMRSSGLSTLAKELGNIVQ
jgi:hypothetical protein